MEKLEAIFRTLAISLSVDFVKKACAIHNPLLLSIFKTQLSIFQKSLKLESSSPTEHSLRFLHSLLSQFWWNNEIKVNLNPSHSLFSFPFFPVLLNVKKM